MTTDAIHLERRGAQRFDFHLAVAVRQCGTGIEAHGYTQDLSGRGALLFTDAEIPQGEVVELTLVMPSEITLTESMRVRCRGKVVRVIAPTVGNHCGLAVQIAGYEFLPDAASAADGISSGQRIAALHDHKHDPESESSSRSHNGPASRSAAGILTGRGF
jgi:hypothetical protein